MTMSASTSPKSSLTKLGFFPKPKPFRVMVLGQAAIGKTALVVRFITRRFIGDYDPNLEQIYTFQTVIDNEMVYFEILDSAGELREGEYAKLEANIRWAEAFILMYSVTDKCSFDECHRLKFLINYNKRRWRLTSAVFGDESVPEIPVVLVGNKTDIAPDRMVSTEDGQRRCKEIGCVCFHEISVRESIEQCFDVFRDARRFWRVSSKWNRSLRSQLGFLEPPRPLTRAASDSTPHTDEVLPETAGPRTPRARRWTESLDEEDEWRGMARSDSASSISEQMEQVGSEDGAAQKRVDLGDRVEGFRARASTDSRLPLWPSRPRHPRSERAQPPLSRRMSVAMRGNNSANS